MRILIIAHQRSGSTSLARWLSMELNHQCILEPFNDYKGYWNYDKNKKLELSINEKNIVCKCLYIQFPKDFIIEKWSTTFDKIILLKRNNIRDSIISEIKANESKNYDSKYTIDDEWIEKNKKIIEERVSVFKEYNDKIDKLNGLHITYEGIYNTKEDIEKVKKYLEIEKLKYSHFIDKKFRYQNNKNTKELI
jgi:hypothetical protein